MFSAVQLTKSLFYAKLHGTAPQQKGICHELSLKSGDAPVAPHRRPLTKTGGLTKLCGQSATANQVSAELSPPAQCPRWPRSRRHASSILTVLPPRIDFGSELPAAGNGMNSLLRRSAESGLRPSRREQLIHLRCARVGVPQIPVHLLGRVGRERGVDCCPALCCFVIVACRIAALAVIYI